MAKRYHQFMTPVWQCSHCGRIFPNKGLAVACESKHDKKNEPKADARTKRLIAAGYVESKYR